MMFKLQFLYWKILTLINISLGAQIRKNKMPVQVLRNFSI